MTLCRRTSRWQRTAWWRWTRRPSEVVLCAHCGVQWAGHDPVQFAEPVPMPRSTVTL